MTGKWLKEKRHRLGGIQENFEEGYKKKWKLSTLKGKSRIKEGECLSILKGAKKVSIEKRHIKCQKSTVENKSSFVSFGVYDKASDIFKILDWLFFKREVGSAL